MVDQSYIDSLLDFAKAIDEGIVVARQWLDSLIENRRSIDVRIQTARANFHGIILQKEYPISERISGYINEHYDEVLNKDTSVRVVHISSTHFMVERLGFQFSIPIEMIKELT